MESISKVTKRDSTVDTVLEVASIAALPLAIGTAGFFIYQGMSGWGLGVDKIGQWWNDKFGSVEDATAADAPGVVAGAFDAAAVLLFGPLGYVGNGTFSDGSRIGDFWRGPEGFEGGGGGGF